MFCMRININNPNLSKFGRNFFIEKLTCFESEKALKSGQSDFPHNFRTQNSTRIHNRTSKKNKDSREKSYSATTVGKSKIKLQVNQKLEIKHKNLRFSFKNRTRNHRNQSKSSQPMKNK